MLIPLLFMGDIVGRLFREFAVTLAVTILVSALVSLTLTPMMSAKLLKHTPDSEQTRFYRKSEEFFDYVIAKVCCGRAVRAAAPDDDAAGDAGDVHADGVSVLIVPKGFFPVQDTGVLLGITEAPQTISFNAMTARQQALARVILQDPDVESVSSFIGVDGTNSTLNSGRIQINLKDRELRKTSA